MEIKIDKGVPVPAAFAAKERFPWREMAVGDSFFAPGYIQTKAQRKNGEPTIGLAFAKRLVPNSKWTLRMVEESGVRGVRVWRVA